MMNPLVQPALIVQSFIGHKGRIFDIRLNQSNNQLLTSSEDSSAKLWDLKSKKIIHSISHDIDTEVLRSSFIDMNDDHNRICTACSNGKLYLWSLIDEKYQIDNTFDHQGAQIYATEPTVSDGTVVIITAADNVLYKWDIERSNFNTHWIIENLNANNEFGGPRNPNNDIFIFDAKFSTNSSIAALGCSDGTIRVLDFRDVAINTKNFCSASESHVTSITWSFNDTLIFAGTGNGDILMMDTRMMRVIGILEGHEKSCFGVNVMADNSYLVSWSCDGSVIKWNTKALDSDAICYQLNDYSIYSSILHPENNSLVVVGGTKTNKSTFIGTPFYNITL